MEEIAKLLHIVHLEGWVAASVILFLRPVRILNGQGEDIILE